MTYENEYVPIELWSKDHWSTLAYVDTVMVDNSGFQVGRDARMRSNRRHFRVMSEDCPNPRRTNMSAASLSMVMRPNYSTVLKDGTVVQGHDDWCCIQDMATAGFFNQSVEEIEPGVVLHFSALGERFAELLRKHKRDGGSFSTFEMPVDVV